MDFDVVVQVSDQSEGNDGAHGQIPRTRELDLRADVADGIPEYDRADDDDAAHGGSARL